MVTWTWQLQPRSRCQSTRRTRFTHTRLVWNFVFWNEFSLKFSLKFFALKWFLSDIFCSEIIQFEILCSEMISVWNFVLWNDFRLKFRALKWIQTENLCSEMNLVWNFILWIFCSELIFFFPLGHRMLMRVVYGCACVHVNVSALVNVCVWSIDSACWRIFMGVC